ncbi:BRO-N domain-containing protein [Symbiopectobacterium purcellii]|uniref:Bro-N domain-containing protein n=1 Tax=Symbiopectobacterium purcellii TaxID=2871826 RepID=A0ABX9AQ82_9ENTR|nr:Bro-N domain-containing protein [Symbiopectobacterium purcellii]
MTALSTTPFTFENHIVRTIIINDDPWFIAQDVCDALKLTNSRMALKALDDDEKADVSLTYTSSNGVTQNRDTNIISESGMFTLVLRCRDAVKQGTLPHRFRKWVTS